MFKELLPYYQDELHALRELSREFAREHPLVADRLLLDSESSQDPHVERLLQGVAFLNARVQRKLNIGFPEVTQALINTLFPSFLAPIPSISMAQFIPDPAKGKMTTGYTISKGTMLYTPLVKGISCKFRTVFPVKLWPILISKVQYGTPENNMNWPPASQSFIKITLKTIGDTFFPEILPESLRFFIDGNEKMSRML